MIRSLSAVSAIGNCGRGDWLLVTPPGSTLRRYLYAIVRHWQSSNAVWHASIRYGLLGRRACPSGTGRISRPTGILRYSTPTRIKQTGSDIRPHSIRRSANCIDRRVHTMPPLPVNHTISCKPSTRRSNGHYHCAGCSASVAAHCFPAGHRSGMHGHPQARPAAAMRRMMGASVAPSPGPQQQYVAGATPALSHAPEHPSPKSSAGHQAPDAQAWSPASQHRFLLLQS